MIYRSKDIPFEIREGTSDYWIIDEVVRDDTYFQGFLTIEPGDIVVDIGAYIGPFSIYAASLGGKVYAYEPCLENFELLKKNIELNKADVAAFRNGVMGKSGKMELCIREGYNYGASNFYHPEWVNRQTVQCITLQDIMKDDNLEHIDFLKMDCEGAEVEILENFPLEKINKISLEYHGNNNRDKILEILKNKFEIKVKGDHLGIILAKKI